MAALAAAMCLALLGKSCNRFLLLSNVEVLKLRGRAGGGRAVRASRARAAREQEVFGGKLAGLSLPVSLAHVNSSCKACKKAISSQTADPAAQREIHAQGCL